MNNLKALEERRVDLQGRMEELVSLAEKETRAMNEEEVKEFDAAEAEIRSIDDTLSRASKARSSENVTKVETEDRAAADEKAFADYIAGRVSEMRADEQNINMANNGAIVPTTIANRIIKAVKDRCPILAGATLYNVKGTLKIPVWGNAGTDGTHNIAVGYQTEFTDITADAGKFISVDLGGYLAGALTLIGKSVANNGAVDVVTFVMDQMAEEIATWIEGQLLNGTGSEAAQGALATTNTMTAAATGAITADELIELQSKVKQVYQAGACWTMNPATFTMIKKLKDGNNRYLLQDDVTGEFPYRLLGKRVYISDNMPAVAAGAKAVLYGDYTGLAVNFRENISVEILREKYATQHVIGVVSWFEFDSKVADAQKLAALVMHA